MDAQDNPEARPRRRWFQFRLRTMLLAVATFAFLLGMLVHFWPHLHWRFGPSKYYSDVQRIPTAPMPAVETPNDWVKCRLGPIEFDLPKPLAQGSKITVDGSGLLGLQDGTTTLVLALPETSDRDWVARFTKDAIADFAELRQLTPGRLKLAMYEVSSNDFRWTMNRQKLAEHIQLLTLADTFRMLYVQRVETLFFDDIEGLLAVGPGRAEFEWFSADGRARGAMNFFDRSGDADLSWVRPVCRSLRFSGECYPDEIKDEELAKLFVILEP